MITNRLLILALIAAGLSIVCGCEVPEPEAVHIESEKPDVELMSTEPVPIEAPPAEEVEAVPLPAEAPPEPEVVEVSEPETKEPEPKPADINQPKVSLLYERWAQLLSGYVDDEGMVNYELLRKKRAELAVVLRDFGNVTTGQYDSWDKKAKISFWLNVYNACTLKMVIDNYPIKPSRYKMLFYPGNSIMQIPKPWTAFEYSIMGEKYTLREIEKGILLRQFNEPRICFALSYASYGSPALRNEPYTEPSLDEQLDERVQDFISRKRGFWIDRSKRTVFLSAILKSSWYGNLFLDRYGTSKKFIDKEPAERAVLNFINNYLSRKDREFLDRKDYSIDYIRYDWRLNEQ